MQAAELLQYLDSPDRAAPWLKSFGLSNLERAHANLVRIASAGMTFDLVATLCGQLSESLPRQSDPDMALNNLERFIAAARSPLSLGALWERDREALPALLQIFSISQYLSELLILDPEAYDLLRMTEGQPVGRKWLADEICAEVAVLGDQTAVMAALRRFKRRETLRIAYGDLVRGQRLDVVTRQISHLADATIEAAVQASFRHLAHRRPAPTTASGRPARFAVLALGKLGGVELNYSSDIDLIFLYDAGRGADVARQQECGDFFDRATREIVKLLTQGTELGSPYRVDLRLRPDGNSGPIAVNFDSALQYYDASGRTWERQAFVKARAAAGDLELGEEFLRQLESWIYRRYLSRADITGIKALKRRIEQRVSREKADDRNVKTGHGGIRDIEFVIQFLQLLNGGDLAALRAGNTLEAIARLASCGCLTHQEQSLLETNYAFLRRIEHRLQIMFDLQTHLLPVEAAELRKLALRMGYVDSAERGALAAFQADYQQKTALNRKILDHLLHDAFADESRADPASDLVLDPEPGQEQIEAVLGRYRFHDVAAAYQNLMTLATEKIRFLSTRRCRHFLAAIAQRLLEAIGRTPDPDFTLLNLSRVSESLGGKGVLWELFSFHPPSLQLYVELCSSSEYLAGILTSNPGMLDDLMDGLLLDRLPSLAALSAALDDLCRGAEDLEPILHSFKNSQHLAVGVRDILGKEEIENITGALSDVAQTTLNRIATHEYSKLVEKYGFPRLGRDGAATEPGGENDASGRPLCQWGILALGKFGGRELNYYSDLDLMFLYQAEGTTAHPGRPKRDAKTTTNQHFFGELGQRIIKTATQLGPHGRLYQIDPRLRPTGKSGVLAVSLAEFERYFASGKGQLWERQALCKARVVFGDPQPAEQIMKAVHQAAFGREFNAADLAAIGAMREKLEATAGPGNLKRGHGGLVDIEFLVQMLQLRHGPAVPAVRRSNTLEAIDALLDAGRLNRDDHDYLVAGFRFLRSIEARLRLMCTTARDTLPENPQELEKLAGLLHYATAESLLEDCRYYTSRNRRLFERFFAPE